LGGSATFLGKKADELKTLENGKRKLKKNCRTPERKGGDKWKWGHSSGNLHPTVGVKEVEGTKTNPHRKKSGLTF